MKTLTRIGLVLICALQPSLLLAKPPLPSVPHADAPAIVKAPRFLKKPLSYKGPLTLWLREKFDVLGMSHEAADDYFTCDLFDDYYRDQVLLPSIVYRLKIERAIVNRGLEPQKVIRVSMQAIQQRDQLRLHLRLNPGADFWAASSNADLYDECGRRYVDQIEIGDRMAVNFKLPSHVLDAAFTEGDVATSSLQGNDPTFSDMQVHLFNELNSYAVNPENYEPQPPTGFTMDEYLRFVVAHLTTPIPRGISPLEHRANQVVLMLRAYQGRVMTNGIAQARPINGITLPYHLGSGF